MTELNTALLGLMSATTLIVLEAAKRLLGRFFKAEDISAVAPIASLILGVLAGLLWTGLGITIPEGVSALAYLGLHGLFAGATASGLYSIAKRVGQTANGE